MTADTLKALRMTRAFDAAPERLFDAWTLPEVAGKWLMTTAGSEAHSAEFDLRVGGQWVIVDRRDGVDYRALGEYLEVDRPRRLAFTFGMPQFSPAFNKVTVEIAADGPGCRMTLIQEELPPEHIPATEGGWSEMFAVLAGVLAG
jgi:uncharacterized protein YndB with AHSA1/START domain